MDAVTSAGGPDVVGKRIAQWVAREAEKDAARAFGVSQRTVKSWRAGQLPQMRHLMAMATRWGEAFLEDVFGPLMPERSSLGERLLRLESEIAAIRRQIDDDNRSRRSATGSAPAALAGWGTGIDSDNVRSVSHHSDELGNRLEVTWLKELESPSIDRFKRVMSGVAGGPPALETWNRQTYGLTHVHVLDVTDTDPNNWRFLARGWTAVDTDDCSRVGLIQLPALKEQAIMSYLNAKAFGDPSVASIRRYCPSVGLLTYNRIIVPQSGSDGRTQYLWVGIEKIAENMI
jgi:hypothetical protein